MADKELIDELYERIWQLEKEKQELEDKLKELLEIVEEI